MKPIAALSVTPEVYPLIKTGGLADVAGALPGALAAEHVELRTLCPGYRPVLAALENSKTVARFNELFGGPARVLAGRAGGLDLLAIDAPHLYDRDGGPYAGPDGRDFADNGFRFAALAKVGAEIGLGQIEGWRPRVVHAHDWQAGLTAAYLHYSGRPRPGSLITVHNLAFQGQFPAAVFPALGLPARAFSIEGVEYYGGVGFLKAGLQLADRVTTVSPTYAEEIQQGHSGMGLDGLLRMRGSQLAGVLNGIDTAVWNPETDPMIAAPFSAKKLAARAENKKALQARMGLAHAPDRLLIGVVSRLSWQKGLDLLLACLNFFDEHNAQLVLLGTGDPALEAAFQDAARQHPGRIAVHFAYEEPLAHLIQAGSDAILVPSRFEPCGLTQLCAMRYGAVPVVSRVGGLADSIIDANEMAIHANCATGLQFSPVTSEALAGALRRCATLHARKAVWKKVQLNGLKTNVSWSIPARHYAALYREVAPA